MTARSDRHSTPDERPAEPILHVDLDAFYASVEVLKDPSLAGKPVIVGGTGARGVVASSASYEARAYGVRSAMPTVRARRLCPDGGVRAAATSPPTAPTRTGSARCCSPYTPLVEPISLDEAFLDVGGATMLFGEPAAHRASASAPRSSARSGSPARSGVASDEVRRQARVRSAASPTACSSSRPTACSASCEPLPVGRLWGVGEKTGELLVAPRDPHGAATCAATPEAILDAAARRAARPAPVAARPRHRRPRGRAVRGAEVGEPRGDVRARSRRRRDPAARAARPLRQGGLAGCAADGYRARTVTMKARLATFTTLTRSKTLPEATDVGADLYHVVSAELYRALPGERRRIRLLGVQASGPGRRRRRAARHAAAGSAGATWSGRSTGSSAASAAAPRCPPRCSIDRDRSDPTCADFRQIRSCVGSLVSEVVPYSRRLACP